MAGRRVAWVVAALVAAAAQLAGCAPAGPTATPVPSQGSSQTPSQTPSRTPGSPSLTPAPPSASSTPSSSSTPASASATRTTATGPSVGPPSHGLPERLRGRVITTLPGAGRSVALTFDGGADARGATRILAILRARGVPASFFVTGRFAEGNRGLVTQLAGVGPVGNHTWSHPHPRLISNAELAGQLAATAAAIRSLSGGDDRPLFRFPFGEYDARTLALVNDRGYAAIGWSVDSLGWKGTSGGCRRAGWPAGWSRPPGPVPLC